jgi:hypothetical protein
LHLLNNIPGFHPRFANEAEVRAAERAHRPTSSIKVALLSNPMAQTNWRSVAHDRLVKTMPNPLLCVSTPAPSDIAWGLDHLLLQMHANVLIINGGDGTIHHTLNAMFELLDAQEQLFGVRIPPPRMLFVNGGGMNMVARTFKTRGHPIRTLRTFLKRSGTCALGELRTLNVPLLKVQEGDRHRLGFIFGSELVHNALSIYERFGRGYRGLTQFFTRLGRGYVLKDAMWEQFGHLITPPKEPLEINGISQEQYGAFVVSTVPMTLALGAVRTFKDHPPRGRMNSIAVHARDPLGIIATIPFLMGGARGPGFSYPKNVQTSRLNGPYTLDGELFSSARGELEISLSGREIEGVILSD